MSNCVDARVVTENLQAASIAFLRLQCRSGAVSAGNRVSVLQKWRIRVSQAEQRPTLTAPEYCT